MNELHLKHNTYYVALSEHPICIIQSRLGSYTMNFNKAQNICRYHGSELAAFDKLRMAQNEGNLSFYISYLQV